MEADAGIMLCEALIARTGSILISSRQQSGRTLPIFPEVNIVIASTKQLVLDIHDGFAAIRKIRWQFSFHGKFKYWSEQNCRH